MTPTEYHKEVLKTESRISLPLFLSGDDGRHVATDRVLHGAVGIATESGELLDALKKSIFYGKSIDTVNLLEEAGDILWYLVVLLESIDCTLDDAMQRNIEKLRARYGETWSKDAALNRDLDKERAILEK